MEKDLTELCALWLSSKNGKSWLTGNGTNKEGVVFKCVGFNQKRKTEKQPAIKIYLADDKFNCQQVDGKYVEVCTLWEKVSKKNTCYYSGVTSSGNNVVAFKGNDTPKAPALKVYLRNDTKPKETPDSAYTEIQF